MSQKINKHIHLDAINIASEYVYADPCYIIPDSLWGEYCSMDLEGGFDWEPREFRGIRFEVKRTGRDGIFHNAFVDSGTIGRFPLSVLAHDFLSHNGAMPR